MRGGRWRVMGSLALGLVAGALPAAQAPAPAPASLPASSPPAVTAARLQSPEPGDWVSYRRTYDVDGVQSAHADRSDDGAAAAAGLVVFAMRDNRRWLPTPIVANGLMYVPEGSGRVVAFDAVSGDVVWIHERPFPDDVAISEAYPAPAASRFSTTPSTGARPTRTWSRSTRGPGRSAGR